MNLNTQKWKTFFLKDLYQIKMGNGFDKNKMTNDSASVNFVSRISYNNGVDIRVDYIDNIEPYPAGYLTVALGGSYLGSCFVQEEPFYTAQNVAVMEPKVKKMTHNVNLFISSLVRYESKIKYYAFGRELNTHINRDFNIKLPILYIVDGTPLVDETHEFSEEGYVPDWDFMENFMMSLHHKPLTTKNKEEQVPELNINEWKEFCFGKLISKIYKSKALNKEDLIEANDNANGIRYITRTAENNGCELIADVTNVQKEFIQEGNAISIGDTTATCFYQKERFITGDHMVVVRADWLSELLALYVVTILNSEQYKYSYGRAFLMDRIKETILRLPIQHNSDGTPVIDDTYKYSEKGYVPDWKFMEDYIKSLPYGDRL